MKLSPAAILVVACATNPLAPAVLRGAKRPLGVQRAISMLNSEDGNVAVQSAAHPNTGHVNGDVAAEKRHDIIVKTEPNPVVERDTVKFSALLNASQAYIEILQPNQPSTNIGNGERGVEKAHNVVEHDGDPIAKSHPGNRRLHPPTESAKHDLIASREDLRHPWFLLCNTMARWHWCYGYVGMNCDKWGSMRQTQDKRTDFFNCLPYCSCWHFFTLQESRTSLDTPILPYPAIYYCRRDTSSPRDPPGNGCPNKRDLITKSAALNEWAVICDRDFLDMCANIVGIVCDPRGVMKRTPHAFQDLLDTAYHPCTQNCRCSHVRTGEWRTTTKMDVMSPDELRRLHALPPFPPA